MRESTVAASLVADMAGYLTGRGLDAAAICRAAGIPGHDESAGETEHADRVPGRAMGRLWQEALAATGDADIGLHAGTSFQPGALDIVGYVMLSSRTADEALRRGARLMRVLNEGLALEVTRAARHTSCEVRVLATHEGFLHGERRHVVETLLVGLLHQLRMLTERAVVPHHVQFAHPAPETGSREHLRLFGVAPSFDSPSDALVLRNDDLDVRLRSANPRLLAAFEAHADAALLSLNGRTSISERACGEIVRHLKGEAPTITVIAKALAMSARHLQRGLSSEGTTFQKLLDDARRELAVRHLSAPDATVAKVAWLVGFSEPSAFHRAFRRWTGHSPRARSRVS